MDNIKDYVTYPKKIKHYDTSKRPKRQTKFAAGVMYILSKALMPRQVQGYKIDKINTENLKPPYILLCNHHTFVDFQINCIATLKRTTALIFPLRTTPFSAIPRKRTV